MDVINFIKQDCTVYCIWDHAVASTCQSFPFEGLKLAHSQAQKCSCIWETGHVGTKYTLLFNKSYLFTGIEYFHSIANITVMKLDKINCDQTVKFYNHTMKVMAEETLEKWSNFVHPHNLFLQPQPQMHSG